MSDLLIPEKIVEEPKKGSPAPAVTAGNEDILDWDVVIPTPPPRITCSVAVTCDCASSSRP